MNNNSLCQIHGVMSVMYVVTKNRFLNYCCNKAAAFIQRQKTSGFYYQDSTIHLIHRPSSFKDVDVFFFKKFPFKMKKLLLNVILLLCSLVCGDMSDVVSILSGTVTPSSGIVGIGDSVVATVKASVEVRFFLL